MRETKLAGLRQGDVKLSGETGWKVHAMRGGKTVAIALVLEGAEE